jgi:hypothetical protein
VIEKGLQTIEITLSWHPNPWEEEEAVDYKFTIVGLLKGKLYKKFSVHFILSNKPLPVYAKRNLPMIPLREAIKRRLSRALGDDVFIRIFGNSVFDVDERVF